MSEIKNEYQMFEQAIKEMGKEGYVFHLYVSGYTPHSVRAIENIRKICETYLKGRYELEVTDIYQKPTSAKEGQIIAAPTLIKALPLPARRLIGDLSDTENVLLSLEILIKKEPEPKQE